MTGCRRRPGSGQQSRRLPFPESTPPGLNHLVVTGTLWADPWPATSPQGDDVTLLRMGFPVRNPERPQELWTWASCDVEVPEPLAKRAVPELRLGAPVFAGGQLSEREVASDGSRRGVLVAAIVHPGEPPSDHRARLLIVGND